jgi:hypothetical protein
MCLGNLLAIIMMMFKQFKISRASKIHKKAWEEYLAKRRQSRLEGTIMETQEKPN